MDTTYSQRSYRRTAVQEASPAGLVVILYDLLVEDLQAAIHAIGCADIEQRSRFLKHALLVLQLLEGGLDMDQGGAAARSLAAFYNYVRRELLDAQFRNDADILALQVRLVLDVREAWRTVDTRNAPSAAAFPPALTVQYLDDLELRDPTQWSA